MTDMAGTNPWATSWSDWARTAAFLREWERGRPTIWYMSPQTVKLLGDLVRRDPPPPAQVCRLYTMHSTPVVVDFELADGVLEAEIDGERQRVWPTPK